MPPRTVTLLMLDEDRLRLTDSRLQPVGAAETVGFAVQVRGWALHVLRADPRLLRSQLEVDFALLNDSHPSPPFTALAPSSLVQRNQRCTKPH